MSWICNSDGSFQKVKIRTSDDHTQQEKKGTSLQAPLEQDTQPALRPPPPAPEPGDPIWWACGLAGTVGHGQKSTPEPFTVLWATAPGTGVSGGWAQVPSDIVGDCSAEQRADFCRSAHTPPQPHAVASGFPAGFSMGYSRGDLAWLGGDLPQGWFDPTVSP